MKRGCLLFFLFLLISAAASSCQQWLYGCSIASQELPERPNELITPRAAAEEDTSKTKEEDVVVVHRCRAEELSPGAALGIVIVLATGSVLHMPGSLLNGKSSLYRLAPELGIFELIQLLLYVGVTFFFRRRSLKLTVTAILVWRYERQYDDDDDDDDDDDTSPITIDEHGANPFLDRIQTFGLSRILGDALMILAFIKSATVKGTVRTNFLAVSYMLPFCTIELLSFAAVRLDPRPKTRAQSEAELAEINNLIQEVKWSGDSTHKPDHLLYKVLSLVVLVILGLLAGVHLLWPFSVPLFFLFEFQEKHLGKWTFIYSTWLVWLVGLAIVAAVLALLASLPMAVLHRFPEKQDKYVKFLRNIMKVRSKFDILSCYALLKIAIIFHFYCWKYTGQGTVTPGWLDWLG